MTDTHALQFHASTEDQTLAIARALASLLAPGDVVTLQVELGAGKTRFVRGIAAGVGLDPSAVSSPTFVLVNIYEPRDSEEAPSLAHVDAYRLSADDDLQLLGWDALTDGSMILAIEWPERIIDHLPESRFHVEMEHLGPHERRITISSADPRLQTLAGALDIAS